MPFLKSVVGFFHKSLNLSTQADWENGKIKTPSEKTEEEKKNKRKRSRGDNNKGPLPITAHCKQTIQSLAKVVVYCIVIWKIAILTRKHLRT